MHITLFTPAFRSAKTIRRHVASLQAQTVKPGDIITVDDGDAETITIAESLGVQVVGHLCGKGLAASCNAALRCARGEFFAKVDSDVELAPDWLERCLSQFTLEVAGVGGRLVETCCSTIADQWRTCFLVQHYGSDSTDDVPLYGAAGVFRTEALRAIGGWNERYRTHYEDMDLSGRLLAAGHHTRYCPAAIAMHLRRDTLESVLTTFWRYHQPRQEAEGLYDSATAALPLIFRNQEAAEVRIASCLQLGLYQLLYPCLLLAARLCRLDIAHLKARDIDPTPYERAFAAMPFRPNVCAALMEASRQASRHEQEDRA